MKTPLVSLAIQARPIPLRIFGVSGRGRPRSHALGATPRRRLCLFQDGVGEVCYRKER